VSASAITVILLVTLGALGARLVGNHFFRQKEPGKTAVEVKDPVAPIGTLAVFLLAFLMAGAFSSYRAAPPRHRCPATVTATQSNRPVTAPW
jgi:hypothetical protein